MEFAGVAIFRYRHPKSPRYRLLHQFTATPKRSTFQHIRWKAGKWRVSCPAPQGRWDASVMSHRENYKPSKNKNKTGGLDYITMKGFYPHPMDKVNRQT